MANKRPNYLPTPKQIREECEAIQATWSERERYMRQYGRRDRTRSDATDFSVPYTVSVEMETTDDT